MHQSPQTLDQALEMLASKQACIVAGGTDFYPAQGEKPFLDPIVDLSQISALRYSSQAADGWHFGAMTTWSDVARAKMPAAFWGLQAAAREVGSLQIQNAGTMAGNLCNASPAADGVPPLLTLDAQVTLKSRRGNRTMPLSQFLKGVRQTELAEDELLTDLFVPTPHPKAKGAFSKLGSRRYLVISICMVAAVLTPDEEGAIGQAAIAVGACSPVAKRLEALERDLIGVPMQEAAIRDVIKPHHLAGLSPIDDVRGSADYRLEAVEEMVRRTIIKTF
ncbi:MAG: FAD binding domain-containing protein [Cohaesibacter sp.]|jgi:CO/xanthine dehydrogenase FAD-binding subunit|nr:FAD binding domain-containing protein [Cohaesibacter sp.]